MIPESQPRDRPRRLRKGSLSSSGLDPAADEEPATRGGTNYGTFVGTMKLSEDIKPVTQLKTGAAKLIDELKQRRRPVVITQNGRASAVMLDVASYERLKNAALMMRLLAMSEAEVSAGRVHSQEEVFAELKQRLTRKRR